MLWSLFLIKLQSLRQNTKQEGGLQECKHPECCKKANAVHFQKKKGKVKF